MPPSSLLDGGFIQSIATPRITHARTRHGISKAESPPSESEIAVARAIAKTYAPLPLPSRRERITVRGTSRTQRRHTPNIIPSFKILSIIVPRIS